MTATLYIGDVHEALDQVPDGTVDVVVTSPPYWGKRDYTGQPAEIGRNQALDSYISEMSVIFERIRWKLTDTGTCWVVVGDTMSGSGGAGGDYGPGGRYEGRAKFRQGATRVPKQSRCNVPGRLLSKLIDTGRWVCRADITWDKITPRTESIRRVRRPLDRSERVFMLTKMGSGYHLNERQAEFVFDEGDVWRIRPSGDRMLALPADRRPKAPYPAELVDRCLNVSAPDGGTVLDPFSGSGMTLARAELMGLVGIGIDLDPDAVVQTSHRFDKLGRSGALTVTSLPE